MLYFDKCVNGDDDDIKKIYLPIQGVPEIMDNPETPHSRAY